MTLFKNKFRVESARLKNWDYSSPGLYFITICTKNRKLLFGNIKGEYFGKLIKDAKMELSNIGKIAEKYWQEIPKHFNNAELDEYIIMPNHVHGIIQIINNDYPGRDVALQRLYRGNHPNMSKISPLPKSLSTIIRSYKSIVTKIINEKYKLNNIIWQSRFYDHIIRNEKELYRIRKYINNNSYRWEFDRNNLENLYI